jgi:hypothetical protein
VVEQEQNKTTMRTIQELRKIVEIYHGRAEINSAELQWVLLMELLLHIYDGLDTMDTRLLQIEQHLEGMANNDVAHAWSNNPFTYRP